MSLKSILEQRRLEKERKLKIRTAKKVATGAAAGILAGIAGGLLFAPKSGKETREDISNKAKEVNDSIKTKADEAKKALEEKTEEVKTNYQEAKEKIVTYLNEKKGKKCCEGSCEEKEAEINSCEEEKVCEESK
ncbi:YtxH domain-containing protein [Desnuesiella massiliensis]|uniref:YtxH domain-containing protein n=1 Tax=Desnuesiella massiliensis TaxID=1650662 RepID=UPI0006E2537A|nr:YtxH domain-containing protein [Desnuesiella massiliensis]